MEFYNPYYWLLYHGRRDLGRTFMIFQGKSISFGEALEKVGGYAELLRDKGVSKGERVAVVSRNSPDMVFLFLACSALGAIFTPVNIRLSKEEVKELFRDFSPRLVFSSEEFLELSGEEALELSCKKGEVLTEPVPPNPEDPHTIIYTSGTTGKPKGVVTPYRKALFNSLNADIFYYGLSSNDTILITLPLFHSGGLFIQLIPALYKGCRIILHERFNPEMILKDVERYGVKHMVVVTTMARMIMERWDIGRLRILKSFLMGGEDVPKKILVSIRKEGVPARKIYGQTETSILIWQTEELASLKPDSTGIAILHGSVKLDKDGKEPPPNRVGEIVARGPIVMKGYWGDKELKPGEWLRTGDLAYRDKKGVFYLVGREKEMFISGGENVYPVEIERVIQEIEGVKEVAVIGVPDERWGEVGACFYTGDVPSEVIKNYLKGKLAKYKIPKYWFNMEHLPKVGEKIDKKKLRELFEAIPSIRR